MNPMEEANGIRKSERTNKGVPPQRFGFENCGVKANVQQNQPELGACGGMSLTDTLVCADKTAKSVISKANTNISRKSIREMELLKKTMERDAEIHEIEMRELQKKKEFLMQAKKFDQEMKRIEEEMSNNLDEDDEIDEVDPIQRKRNTSEWVKKMPDQFENANDFESRFEQQVPHPNNFRREEILDSTRRNEIFESTRRNRTLNCDQDDVLIAAFKALQTREAKDLPEFDGENVLDWPNFISEFHRSTKEFNISPSKNLRRLNKALQGNAKTSVQILLTSPDNINKIISHLGMSYGRPEWILHHLISELRELPSMKEENIHQFKLYYNKLFGTTTTIRNMNAMNYMQNPELLACLEEKLPPATKNFWIHYKADLRRRNENVTIAELEEWFKYELDAQFAGLSAKDVLKKPAKAKVLTVGSSQPPKKEKWCYKCDGASGHYLQDCKEFKKMTVDQRRELVKKNNICFLCLIKGHQSRICRKRNSLPKCTKCNKGHADILHMEDVPVEEVRCIKTCDVLLKIVMVIVKGPLKTMIVPAFFDDGSTATMIDEDLANELDLDGKISPITYRWTNDIVRTDNESRIVNVQISSINKNAKVYELKNVRTGKNLAIPFQKFNVKDVLLLHPYLKEEMLRNVSDVQPLLLIGSNNASLTSPLKTNQYRMNGPIECKSRLGWTVHGPIYESTSSSTVAIHLYTETQNEMNLNDLMKQTYEIENFGVNNESEKLSIEDESALKIMKTTMKNIGDRFEVGHLYKYPGKKFPTEESKQLAMKRLFLVERKMDRDPKFADEYIQRVNDYVEKGYAEKLTGDDAKDTFNTFYLPHFDAHNPNKPGKFRWVMDAKAKAGNYALNDLLLQGPDFVPPLLAVLWRARLRPIGINSDIAEMFHQVQIRREDQDCQRFLFRGKDRDRAPDIYRMKAMIFGAVSSPSVAQFVKNENAKSFEKQFPGVERAIVKQHYVDDYVDSTNDVDEAITLAANVSEVHKKGGFRLVKWCSNSTEFMQSFPEEMRLPNYDQLEEVRMLGITWNFRNDELVFNFDFKKFDQQLLDGRIVPTKRQMLKFLMSIYDPLGVLSPLVIKLKILFQELWRLDIKWDDQIPEGIFEKWNMWLAEAKSIQQVRIPRCYFPFVPRYSDVQLHTFTDAGEKAYCAMTFIRIEMNGEAYVALIQAKSRVAPIKQLTIPRLEMQAAVTGSQIAHAIQKELDIPIVRRFFWTDSTIVLGWINSKEKLGPFIGSRTTKILDCSKREEWFWIPTHLNTADLATKTTNSIDLSKASIWFNGPEFLKIPESQWPQFIPPTPNESEILMYVSELEPTEEVMATIRSEDPGNSLPDIKRFSKYNRLIRSTAYILKMVKNLKFPKMDRPKSLSINVHDLHEAENLWYREVQRECYQQELHDLKCRGFVKTRSCLYQLSPIINSEGIICMQGRIPGENPIILPQKHPFTKLLVSWYHQVNIHQGVDTVINHLREKFWIPKCRTVVNEAFKSCMLCRVRKPKVKLVEMGDIPVERSEKCDFPFTYAGMDYFGPIMVKYGRRYEKVWGALFTCLTTRGIHVELASSLTTTSAIMALTRFMNLRGVPRKIFSDNGTNFVGADNELSEFINNLDNDVIERKLSIRGVEWVFNCPAAPNRGGAWERMVGSVKEGLKVLVDTEFPSFEILSTALSEVVNTVNNRPLTYVSSSTDNFNITAITPNDIILLRPNHSQYDVKMDYNFNPRETWKMAHKIADEFWHRWVKEYRPLLLKRTKWPDNRNDPQLEEGDLVRIVDENEIRGRFPKGIIVKVFPDRKGIVRTAEVECVVGDSKRKYKRPISKLAKIIMSEGLEDVIEETARAIG